MLLPKLSMLLPRVGMVMCDIPCYTRCSNLSEQCKNQPLTKETEKHPDKIS